MAQLAIPVGCAAVRSDRWIVAGMFRQQVVVLKVPSAHTAAAAIAAGSGAAFACGVVTAGRRRAPHARSRARPRLSMRDVTGVSRRDGGWSSLKRWKLQALRKVQCRSHRCRACMDLLSKQASWSNEWGQEASAGQALRAPLLVGLPNRRGIPHTQAVDQAPNVRKQTGKKGAGLLEHVGLPKLWRRCPRQASCERGAACGSNQNACQSAMEQELTAY